MWNESRLLFGFQGRRESHPLTSFFPALTLLAASSFSFPLRLPFGHSPILLFSSPNLRSVAPTTVNISDKLVY